MTNKLLKLVAVMTIMAAVATGCTNNDNNKEVVDNTVPSAEANVAPTKEPAPVVTVAPSEDDEPTKEAEPTVEPDEPTTVPTDEPTEVPTEAPTVEPTKEPTKAPVATKTPATKTPATKKPTTTKTPTKAPATKAPTKKPTATKTPNAAGEPYKVGNVTVTPVSGVTMWSKNGGNIRTKPWTGDGSVVVGQEYYSEIKVTGICSNGFIQYKVSEKNGDCYTGTVYINKKYLYTDKPKEFIMNGYDPVYVIKEAHKRLEAKGFHLWTADYDEVVADFKANIAELEKVVEAMENGTFDFVAANCWTEEERNKLYEKKKNGLEATKKALADYIQFATVDIHKHKKISDPDEELGSYEGVTFNINLNRLHINSSVLTAGCENVDDIINCIVEQYEYNREVGSARQDYVWVYYGIIEKNGETYYRFYLT